MIQFVKSVSLGFHKKKKRGVFSVYLATSCFSNTFKPLLQNTIGMSEPSCFRLKICKNWKSCCNLLDIVLCYRHFVVVLLLWNFVALNYWTTLKLNCLKLLKQTYHGSCMVSQTCCSKILIALRCYRFFKCFVRIKLYSAVSLICWA